MQKHSIIIQALGLFLISTGAFKFFTDQSTINLWLVVPLEIIVGVFSLLRPKLNATHWTLLFLFATFSIYTATNIFQNNNDCGCLGAITINPWFTLIFDISVFIYLIAIKQIDDQNIKLLTPTCITIAASLMATTIYFQLNKATTPPAQTSTTNNTNFPEISSLNISNPLSSTNPKTEKTIFIYDQHCPLCLNIASQSILDAIDISQAQDYIQNDSSNTNQSNRSLLPWLLTNNDTSPTILLKPTHSSIGTLR
ncbi:hypothetical protein JD969_06905 [Planctomycetota bacterium]|nr:hypothetical protein JD969_06905 [Planctomycetota bacterium]